MASNTARKVPRLRARDGDCCHLCGGVIDFDRVWPDQLSATVDHLVPRRDGGGNELANLRLAHHWCNRRRGHRPVQVFAGEGLHD